MELRRGAVIAGRYRVDQKIGSGGMGEVWSGQHVTIGVRVALKTLLPAAALDRQLVARFRREAQLLGRMRSDRVARVVDFIEDRAFGLVLVMDFVEGDPLGSVLQTRRLGVEEAIDLGVDLAGALCDLHRADVVHRDLKPDNIILEPVHGSRRRAVIVDLGVSRLLAGTTGEDSVTSITQVDMAVGTLPYMAPEQLLSSSTVTGAADVYAVGAILYRAVAGEAVFGDGDDVLAAQHKIAGEAPPLPLPRFDRVAKGLAAVVARALKRLPGDRFENAEELQRELVLLQDLARAMSFDLEAATEEALPASLVLSVDAPAEQTRRMSRPPVVAEGDDDFDDEATQLSPASLRLIRGLRDAPRTPAPAAPPVSEPPATSMARTLSSPHGSSRPTRPTVLSPVLDTAAAPNPPAGGPKARLSATLRDDGELPGGLLALPDVDESLTLDEPTAPPRTITLRVAVLGLIAALAVGTALGFEAHRLVERQPASSAPR
jgi:eukaryotic-like serine/threonine-protein kinase